MRSDSDQPGTPPTIGVSAASSPNISAFGMDDGHFRAALSAIAVRLISEGVCPAYGGRLRQDLSDLLFELVISYRGHPDHRGPVGVLDYLAWPEHIRMANEDLVAIAREYKTAARIIRVALLSREGDKMGWESRLRLSPHEPDTAEWHEGLTSMRRAVCEDTCAHLLLGGRVSGHRGRMPGIAEGALFSLRSCKPVYLLGGFGGCARDIAETLGLATPRGTPGAMWPGRREFEEFGPDSLHNGLDDDDNRTLASTPHVGLALTLVLRGLRRLRLGP